MREILFRGKVEDDFFSDSGKLIYKKGEWVYGYLASPDVIVGGICDMDENYISFDWWVTVDPITVGQYTGLTDKNGKEIYEGDIVRNGYTCHYPSGSSSDFYNNGTVFMDVSNGCWAIDNGEHDAPKRITVKMINERNIEVIGNIHDNPELLEEEK